MAPGRLGVCAGRRRVRRDPAPPPVPAPGEADSNKILSVTGVPPGAPPCRPYTRGGSAASADRVLNGAAGAPAVDAWLHLQSRNRRWKIHRLHHHPSPERDPPSDLTSSWAGLGLVPGGIPVLLVTDDDGAVTRGAVPRAAGVLGAVAQVLAVDGVEREGVVPPRRSQCRRSDEQRAVPGGSVRLSEPAQHDPTFHLVAGNPTGYPVGYVRNVSEPKDGAGGNAGDGPVLPGARRPDAPVDPRRTYGRSVQRVGAGEARLGTAEPGVEPPGVPAVVRVRGCGASRPPGALPAGRHRRLRARRGHPPARRRASRAPRILRADRAGLGVSRCGGRHLMAR